jgi:hypothetical protein
VTRRSIKLPALHGGRRAFSLEPADGWYVEAFRNDIGDHWKVVRHEYDGSILPGYPRFFVTRADAEMFVNRVFDEEAGSK